MTTDNNNVDVQLEQLEVELERMRQKQAKLQKERELQKQNEDLQHQIDMLQQQLQLEDNEHDDDDEVEESDDDEEVDAAEEEEVEVKEEIKEPYLAHSPAIAPKHAAEAGWKNEQLEEQLQEENDPNHHQHDPVMEQQRSPGPQEYGQPVKGASELAKQKHGWSKPAWALPDTALPEENIQKDSIQNPLLKKHAAGGGYERKVKPTSNLALISGKFVSPAPTVKKPEPRLVWIVVNIDGCKVGKIVMHLYGVAIAKIVDVFDQLKGLPLERCPEGGFVVPDMDPIFYIVQKYSGSKKEACYGVIQEGMDIYKKLQNAPQDAVFTIKQSHIYPVKKAKS